VPPAVGRVNRPQSYSSHAAQARRSPPSGSCGYLPQRGYRAARHLPLVVGALLSVSETWARSANHWTPGCDVTPCQAASLVIVQPKSAGEDLCTQDSVLLTKVINNLLLFLIHPAGNGDEQETKGVEGPGHRCRLSLSYA
jgi:hypothetical protein